MDLARKLNISVEKIMHRVHELHEFNPMLGFRGCRLGIKYPEITRMQARAVLEAAADATKQGFGAKPAIMIPLVGFKRELDLQTAIVHEVAAQVQKEKKVKITYSVGTMIEIPRGALTADEIAQTAEFFSFGTNDLTQTTLGMSRDDSGSFLGAYQEAEMLKKSFAPRLARPASASSWKSPSRRAARRAPISSSASAANMAAILIPWNSAIASD